MIDSKKIKVVKRTDIVPKQKKKRVAGPRDAARKIVSNVSDWVSDIKHRKSEETKAAIELLFAANQRPSES